MRGSSAGTRVTGIEGSPAAPRLEAWTWVALVVVLVGRPVAYTLLPIGRVLVAPIFAGERASWFGFHSVLLAFQWVPFLLIAYMLRRTGAGWLTLGVDWHWFGRRWKAMAALLAALVAGALFLPGVYYDGTLPRISGTIFLAPVSTAERLFMILVAASAGIAEEVQYRGLPFTRLGPVLGSPWFVLPITMVSFLFVHGGPDSVQMAINYLAIGMAFGVAFLLLRRRRLEWLMLIHFLIDASMVLAP